MTSKEDRLKFWQKNIKDIKKRIKVTKADFASEGSMFRKEILNRILADDNRRLKIATEFSTSLGGLK